MVRLSEWKREEPTTADALRVKTHTQNCMKTIPVDDHRLYRYYVLEIKSLKGKQDQMMFGNFPFDFIAFQFLTAGWRRTKRRKR